MLGDVLDGEGVLGKSMLDSTRAGRERAGRVSFLDMHYHGFVCVLCVSVIGMCAQKKEGNLCP